MTEDEIKAWSVLPQIVSATGDSSEPISEALFADAISGGQDYVGGMPRAVYVVRKFADGREIRRRYEQTD